MLESLQVENFTVFEKADFQFGKNINLFVGENGTGKTHVLKLLYAISWIGVPENAENPRVVIDQALEYKLEAVFKGPIYGREGLTDLFSNWVEKNLTQVKIILQHSNNKKISCNLDGHYSISGLDYDEVISLMKSDEYNDEGLYLETELECTNADLLAEKTKVIFIPAKEIISWTEQIAALKKDRSLTLDDTYNDLISNELTRSIRDEKTALDISFLTKQLETILGGKIIKEDSKFYLQQYGAGYIEMSMLAEGWRKIALLLHLINYGSLVKNSVLFIDEPESNLNPKLIRQLARVLVALSLQNVQLFIATHNMVFLKEIELEVLRRQNESRPVPDTRFFALHREDASLPIQVSTGERLHEISPLIALDESIKQAEEFLKLRAKGL